MIKIAVKKQASPPQARIKPHTMHDRTSKALGTVETSNHSYQAKAPVKATRTKMNGTFLLKCLAAFCMLGNATASPTPTCGHCEKISFPPQWLPLMLGGVDSGPSPPSPPPPQTYRSIQPWDGGLCAMPGQTNSPGGNAYCCSYTDPTLLTKQDCEDKCDADVGRCVAYSWKRSYTDCNLYDAAALPDLAEVVGSRSLSPPQGHWDANCYISAAYFTVVGPCTVDGACARSPNYPSEYGRSQSCTITPTSLAVGQLLSATDFTTESRYDKLIVNGVTYSGTTGPSNALLGSASFTWSSDGSVHNRGWEVCAQPPPPCDCDYHPGGCSISQAAPAGQACKCSYSGGWTCSGDNWLCSDPNSPLCATPDYSVASCLLGGGDCGGYSGASDCDCDYYSHGFFSGGGCLIPQAAPAYSACDCSYLGGYTCGGDVVRCHDEGSSRCASPDMSKASCQLGGGD